MSIIFKKIISFFLSLSKNKRERDKEEDIQSKPRTIDKSHKANEGRSPYWTWWTHESERDEVMTFGKFPH